MKPRTLPTLFVFLTLLALTFTSLGLTPASAAGYGWGSVGAPGFSAWNAKYTSLAIHNGTPYVAYQDAGNSWKATVMKFDGSAWVNVGAPGFSVGQAQCTSLALDSNGVPYVAYQDGDNSWKATVMKFDGSAWVPVGAPGFSAGGAYSTFLALDASGAPYVAYQDGGNANKATVMKFDGSAWVNVGAPGFSAGQADYISLALDGSGAPYVAYTDGANSNKATVMKFDGSAWVDVGAPGFSASGAWFTSLALDGSSAPYVAYQDGSNSSKATVMKFDGGVWAPVGAAGFSTGAVQYISLVLDGSGAPYVAYLDADNSAKASAMKFDAGSGSWVSLGAPGFSASMALHTSLALDASGAPYVAYMDYGYDAKATVMKYAPAYAVTYDGNGNDGGTAPTDSKSYIVGSVVTVLDNDGALVKTGYIFSGWNTQPDGSGTTYKQYTTFTMGAADLTLYAKWLPGYTVTYDGNGADSGTAPVDFDSPYTSGATVTVLDNADALAKTGYVFGGWNTQPDGSGTTYAAYATFTMGPADLTLYARWLLPYTVTYDGNGADSGTAPVDSAIYTSGATVTALGNTGALAKTGYVFGGWNTQPDGSGTTYAAGATFVMGSADLTLYARWLLTYTVTYDGNGADSGTAPGDNTIYPSGSTVTVLGASTLVKARYSLAGWNTQAGGLGTTYREGATFTISANTTLYAKWELGSWGLVGAPRFSADEVGFTSLAIHNGTPYVAYADYGNASKATVMKFDGSAWTPVGVPGFSTGSVQYTSLALDGSGTPYVAYRDYGNASKATVMKFDGSAWVNVGAPGFSAGSARYTSLALDGSGAPYVAYQDGGNASKATVMKFDGSQWVAVGAPGFSADIVFDLSLALDGNGLPYVAYTDLGNSGYATVMKYDGSAWTPVGAPGFSVGEAYSTSLALDASGAPYVAYEDGSNLYKVTVMKFDGSQWVNVGAPGFSSDGMESISLALDGSGAPYVAYSGDGNAYKATVVKFDGSAWVNVGQAEFSASDIYYPSLALDGSGTPYLAYADYADLGQATVMKYLAPRTVTYNGNGNTGGTAPADTSAYLSGDTVTVLGNTGVLVKTGYTFAGWNTQANGLGTTYKAGNTFTLGSANVTLYAKWTAPIIERLKNGGFETYLGLSKIPRYWTAVKFGVTDGKDAVTKKVGKYSVKIIGSAAVSKTLSQTIVLKGLPGDPFNFTVWAKGTSLAKTGICQAQVILYNGAAISETKTVKCPTGTFAWRQMKLTFAATKPYTKFVVKFTFKKTGTIWFDVASLKR